VPENSAPQADPLNLAFRSATPDSARDRHGEDATELFTPRKSGPLPAKPSRGIGIAYQRVVIRKALTLLTGLALLNLALFVICVFWSQITQFLSTDAGIYFLFFMALALAAPSLYRVHARRKEATVKKQEHATRLRRRVESEIENKDIGIDF
jgi:hypothetical protein